MLIFIFSVLIFFWLLFYRQIKVTQSYYYFFSLFFNAYFSYFLTDTLIFQRQTDPKFSFIILDPNSIVYCFFYLFGISSFLFTSIFFFRYFFKYISAFFYKKEFWIFCCCCLLSLSLFVVSYIIIDYDISRNFILKGPIVSKEGISYKLRSWDFSIYFFNFFGLFFDFLSIYVFIYVLFFVYILFTCNIGFNSSPSKLKQKYWFSWFIRRCTSFATIYYFSGETFTFDVISFFITFFWRELFFLFIYIVYWLGNLIR